MQYVVLEQTERLAGAFHTWHLAQSWGWGLAVTLCHTPLPFTIRRTPGVTVNPPWNKSFLLVTCPLVYLNALNQANHKSDAHISKISLNKSKYFYFWLTKIVNYTTEHLNLRHSEFVLNRQTHILCYTLSSCPGLKTKCCRCVAKPISSKLINFLKGWMVLVLCYGSSFREFIIVRMFFLTNGRSSSWSLRVLIPYYKWKCSPSITLSIYDTKCGCLLGGPFCCYILGL